MTNYAGNYTPRVKIEYTVDSVEHTATLRFPRDDSPTTATAIDLVEAWRLAMAAIYGTTGLQAATNITQADISSCALAEQDSDLFLPFAPDTTEIIEGDDSGGGPTPLSKATLLSVTGLTTGGGKVSLYLWGARTQTGLGTNYADWRFGPSELTGLSSVWSAHFDPDTVGSLADLLGGADGSPVAFFRQRLNVRVSASAINSARG